MYIYNSAQAEVFMYLNFQISYCIKTQKTKQRQSINLPALFHLMFLVFFQIFNMEYLTLNSKKTFMHK